MAMPLRPLTPMQIAQAVQITAALDAGVKGHSADPEFAVEDAVRKIAQVASSATRR